MPKPISKMANTPVSIEYKGKEIKLSAMTPGDLGELEKWVKNGPMRDFKSQIEAAGDVLLPEERAALFEAALAESKARRSLSSPESQAAQQCAEGVAFVLWLLARHCDPNLTYADALACVTFNREETERAMNEVLGLDEEGDEDEDEDEKKLLSTI